MQVYSSARTEKNIRIGAVLALGIGVLVAFVTWRSISRMVQDGRWVEHTMLVLDNVDNLDALMTRRQAAGRVYQLTGSPAFYLEYKNLSADVRRTMSSLKSLTSDNPREQDQLRAMKVLLDRSSLAISRGTGALTASSAKRSLAAVGGDAVPPAFAARISAMRNEEHRLLNLRRSAEANSIRITYVVLTMLGLMFAGILSGTYLLSKRALESRRAALEQGAHLNAELEMANLALEHKRREADHANKLKSQFLASMSHELRTPLNAISGFSELLTDELAGPLNEKQGRFLRHIREASRHLLQLINDILDLSKIEAGEIKLEIASFSPAAVIHQVVAGVGSLAREKSIHLQAECDAGLVLPADQRRLTQILYNLLSNAIKFTPAGGSIGVRAAPDGAMLRFEVTDTGPGIQPEDQKIIFEEFRQAAVSTSGVKEGTGLGLAITKKLVERHGGRIEVESQPGAGSVFRFWLPTGMAPSAPAPLPRSPGKAVAKVRAGDGAPLILVIDDELNARELIRSVLESAGYRVLTADSSSSALQAAREFKPDLITLDLLMPGGNGFGTLYDLRMLYQDSPPPVVIVSVVDDRATGFALGAADYLIKPVSKTDLLEVVRRHLPQANAGLLVIDDDPAILELAREAFSKPWIRLYLARSGGEGLAILNSEAIDAIVLDLMMPEMDGFEFLKTLRSQKRLEHIPVSILTSKDLSEFEVRQLRNRVNSIFSKSEEWKSGLVTQIAQSLGRIKSEEGPPA